jgi:alpha-L-glutamate ligase-like protein
LNNLSLVLKNRKLILGRNERYLEYIRKNNLRKAIRIADDKVLTKKVLKRSEIPVPSTVKVIKSREKVENFDFNTLPNSFVIKPVRGVRGSGIEIFYNRDKQGRWIRADGSRVSIDDLKVLCRDIIDGKYSLFNEPDTVLIEERVKPHKVFKPYTYKGTPDVRVIVYNQIPIMSYIRIPTEESNGKANLDLGAIAAGIDIAVGKTTYAIIGKGTPIEYVPNTRVPLSGLKIPFWDTILKYAIETSRSTGLGYAAVDFLIDRDNGPMIVELNARPGLSIQIANQDGLRWRLKKAKGIKVKSTDHGMRIAKDLFGGEIEEEIEAISGKQVIGLIVDTKLHSKDGLDIEELKAKVDTGADTSSIDTELARRLGYEHLLDIVELKDIVISDMVEERLALEKKLTEELKQKYEDLYEVQFVKSGNGISLRPYILINMEIEGIKFESKVSIINRSHLNYLMILGKNTLSKFLIDSTKKS